MVTPQISLSAGVPAVAGALKCNVCDEMVNEGLITQHVASRNHSIRKKVAQFNEMNIQFKPTYQDDISTVRAWIKDLHKHDYLSMRQS